MAKLNSTFKFNGTFGDVTVVKSRAYGEHIRKARTKFTISKEMKKSTENLKLANVYAKAFKDAIDPYRRDFRDGQLWQRLLSLFKTQLSEEGKVDFKILDGEELNKMHPLNRIITARAAVSQSEGILKVTVSSFFKQNPTQSKANGYQQTIIVLFADRDLNMESFSESVHFSFDSASPVPEPTVGRNEQTASWKIPDKATVAIVVTKCNFSVNSETLSLQKGMGMQVLKVIGVGE